MQILFSKALRFCKMKRPIGNSAPRESKKEIPNATRIIPPGFQMSIWPDYLSNEWGQLYPDTISYFNWYNNLSNKDKKVEFANFFLDGDGKKIIIRREEFMRNASIRMEYIRKIEKLKREGKLRLNYRVK